MKIIGIIPAREGSKRLKHKNTYPLKGIPLIEYSIKASLKSKYLNTSNIFVSTNFDQVKEISRQYRVNVIDRPEELAEDHIWTQDVINHVDDTLGGLNDEDLIVIIQANSPQMDSSIIDACIDKLISNNLWQVHTVDEELINNGAVQVMKRKLRNHSGKANYNGVVVTDWIDVHTVDDIKSLESIL
jgi:CMP-N-acetylneuraminic acid synthetase